MTYLSLLLIAVIFFLILPKRDFYLVELRQWRDGTMTTHAQNYAGYTRRYLKKGSLKIYTKRNNGLILHHSNGGIIKIDQFVFSSFDAAKIYLELLKSIQKTSQIELAIELNLWKVVAKTYRQAHIISPTSYASREAILLTQYQPHFPEKKRRVVIQNDSTQG